MKYRVLVISNLACVSDEVAAVIERFAVNGGTLIAGFEAGFCHLDGERRTEPAFARLLGGRYAGRRDNLKSSYAKLEHRDDPLLAGLGDTDLIPNDGALIEVEPAAASSVPLTLIPPVVAHDGATISIPEYSAIQAVTTIPVVMYASAGRGRFIYFANAMECLYYRYGFPDLGRVLANAVRFALGDAHHVEIDAPDFVDMSLMRQPQRMLVHLINLPVDKPLNTGWRHPGRNLVPVSDIALRLKVEHGVCVRQVRLATSETVCAHRVENEVVHVAVPALADHEIVIFELESS